ncbi:MAG: EAL domain-containing protein [Piscirickettsiaceae bacterium]|nr:EAL domain-containing protein [Piscirickettsiaceae bacterium]
MTENSVNTDNKTILSQAELQQLDIDRVGLLLVQGPTAIITSAVVSIIVGSMLWNELNHSLVILWVTFVITVILLRMLFIKYIKQKLSEYEQKPLDIPINKYEYLYAIGSFWNGLALGIITLAFEPSWSISNQFILPLAIIGMVAGALSSNTSSLRTYFSFILPLILPLIFIFYTNDLPYATLLTVIYLAMMASTLKRMNNTLVEVLKLKIHNVTLVNDLTENNRQQSQLLEQLRRSEQLASDAFNNAGVAMSLIDSNMTIFQVNEMASKLIGYTHDEMIGMELLLLSNERDQVQSKKLFAELIAGKRKKYQQRKQFIHKNGSNIWVHVTVSSICNESGNFEYAVLHAQDISQEKQLTEKLTHQAEHDFLTGLPNRQAFEYQLQTILQATDNTEHILCYIDLDQFKVVNDTSGHIAGDELLKQLSQVIRNALRKSDLLARVGGDEFAILMFNCSMDAAKRQLEILLSKIRDFRFIYEGQSFNVGASLGLVLIDSNSTMTEVLKQADSACYAAKDAGRDRLHIFTHDDEALTQRSGEMQWVSRIQQALTNDMFVLYYQEIVQIDGKGTRPHYEMLIRMKGEDGKIIPPGLFLPAAERYNLAAAIDSWVIEHVLTTLNVAHLEGKDISGVYGINISGHSLGDPRFYESIIKRISSSDLREFGAYICFEITETAAVSNMTAALHFINELRAIGCQFALDDFGSGLSSFAYLKQMPIDYLKIDGMFVKDCLTDPVNLEMIDSIHGIGHVMGLKTIAEFVENDEIFNKLAELGVDYAQGYWNGPPQPWIIEDAEWEIEIGDSIST